MSFLINWDLLNDGAEADGLRDFLNARFDSIDRPPFLGPLKVTELDFGDVPPEVAVIDICDPAAEFYLPDDPEVWRPSTPPVVPLVAGLPADVLSGSQSPTLVENASGWLGNGSRGGGEDYFYGSHHPVPLPHHYAHSDRFRQRSRRSRDADAELDALASARNMSSDNFGALVAEQRAAAAAAARRVVPSTPPPQPFFPRPAAYAYGSGWSGSVGLGLGLGIGATHTASNHSYPLHSRPVFSSAPPSLRPSMSYALSDRQSASGYADDDPLSVPEIPVAAVESPRPPCRTDHEVALEYAETMRRPSDAQVEFEIVYKGNMRLAIQTELIVNQPTPAFMVLPLVLTLTGFQFTASALISYLGDRVNFCFKESDAGTTILQDVSIDSEVGDGRKQGVLKNVGRIERFIVEQLRKVIQDFLVFPNHHSLKLLDDPVHSEENIYDDGSEPFDDGLSYEPYAD